jgi:hypothetical protein
MLDPNGLSSGLILLGHRRRLLVKWSRQAHLVSLLPVAIRGWLPME